MTFFLGFRNSIIIVILRPRPHVSVFVWKRNYFSPFSNKFASTRSVFRSFSPVHTKTLKTQRKYCWACMRIYHAFLSLRFTPSVWIYRSQENRLKRVRLTRLFVLQVTIEYKVAETRNVDLDVFVVPYLSPEEIISKIACTCNCHPSIFPWRFMQSRNIKSPYPVILFRAGRLDPILIRHRFRKVPFSTIHRETRKRRFQKIPLLRAFSKSCVFGGRFHRITACGRKPYPQRKSCVFKWKRIRVDGALLL